MALLSMVGCESAQQRLDSTDLKNDFGSSLETQPITAESVGEASMLHRRWQLELNGHASIPTGFFQKNDFDIGPSAGIKAEIETAKDLFVGISFDYSNWKLSNGLNAHSDPAALSNLRPDQLYQELRRYDFLLAADRDWTLSKDFIMKDAPLKFRLGGGLGASLIKGDLNSFIKDQAALAGTEERIPDYVGLLVRITVGLRWQLNDRVILFTDAGYDFVTPFKMQIEINRQKSEVNGKIDYGSINVGAGIAFEF